MSRQLFEITPYQHALNLKAQRAISAQEAYEIYEFGSLVVELRGQGNWTFAFGDKDVPVMFRTITIFEDKAREKPILAQFIVEFDQQSAAPFKAYARSNKTTFWGAMPDGYFDVDAEATIGMKFS
jgi:hypothetical protein